MRKITAGLFVFVMIATTMIGMFGMEAEATDITSKWTANIGVTGTTFAFVKADANNVYVGLNDKIYKIDASDGAIEGNITLSNIVILQDAYIDNGYLYAIGRLSTSSPYGLGIVKVDLSTFSVAKTFSNATWDYAGYIYIDSNYIYVSGNNGAQAIIQRFNRGDITEADAYYGTAADNAYFFEMTGDDTYLYAAYRHSDVNSSVYKLNKADLSEVKIWGVNNDYNLRNIVFEGNTIVVCSRDAPVTQRLLYFDTDLALLHEATTSSKYFDLEYFNETSFVLATYEGKVKGKGFDNSTIWEIAGFTTNERLYLGHYGIYVYIYDNGDGKLYAYQIGEASQPSHSYIEQNPISVAEADAYYENYKLAYWGWLNATQNYDSDKINQKSAMTDKRPLTHYRTVAFDIHSSPLVISWDYQEPTSIGLIRFYYYDENGLQYCPAWYEIYCDGNLVATYNYTAKVNGQWVIIDIPDKQNVNRLEMKIYDTKGSIDTGNSNTKVSIAEIEVFTTEAAPSYPSQSNVQYFDEITQWWNGLNWSMSWRIDDVTSPSDLTQFYGVMPLTACWMENFASIDDSIVTQHHVEIGGHYQQLSEGTQANYGYAWWHDKGQFGISQIEANSDKVSLWSDKVISYGIPFSRINQHGVKGLWDAGYRMIGYSDVTSGDKYPQYRSTATWTWRVIEKQNMTSSNVILPHSIEDYAFYRPRGAKPDAWDDSEYIKAKENHSWILTISHPGETVSQAFKDFVAQQDDCWLATLGEVASYDYLRRWTTVTINSNSNDTVKIFDINAQKPDTRMWEVPLTFKFSGLNNISKIEVRWTSNSTLYKTLSDIGNAREMQEGYRIDGNSLYVSTKPIGKSIYIYLGSQGSNNPPTCNLSADPTSGDAPLTVTFTMMAGDSDGSIASWALDVDNDGTPEYNGTGSPPSTQSHTYSVAGSYTAKLTVTDDDGATAYDTVTITVNSPGNHAPVLSNPQPANGSTDVQLKPDVSIYVSDPDGDTMTITINLTNADGGWQVTTFTGSNGTYSIGNLNQHINTTGKTYYWTVTADDGHGGVTTATYHFTTEGGGGGIITGGDNSVWMIALIAMFGVIMIAMIVFVGKR